MNRVIKLAMVAMIALSMTALTGCWTTVEPGYVGIKVNKHGNQRGVEDFPISTGRVMLNPFTETVYVFPTFMQRVPWTASATEGSPNDESITFNSIEGAPISVDVAFAGSFASDSVPAIFVEFRKPAMLIVDGWVRDRVRNCLNEAGSTRQAVSILGKGKMDFLKSVNACTRTAVEAKGFEFDSVSLLGEARVPENVRNSIERVIEQTQAALAAEAKVKQTIAEARQVAERAEGERLKRVAEAQGTAEATLLRARATAEGNRLMSESLTPALIEYKALEVWDGILPKFTGGGAVPFINVDTGE